MKIYQIDSSARKEGSSSRELAKKLLDKIKTPGDEVIYRDLDDEMVFVSGLTESGMKIEEIDRTEHHKKMFELFVAFGAGLISFLSPCVLPLIPGYVSFVSGQSLQEILNKKKKKFTTTCFILPRFLNCFYYFWCYSFSNRAGFFTKLKYSKNNCKYNYNSFFTSINWSN